MRLEAGQRVELPDGRMGTVADTDQWPVRQNREWALVETDSGEPWFGYPETLEISASRRSEAKEE